jgi:hypothetical protein
VRCYALHGIVPARAAPQRLLRREVERRGGVKLNAVQVPGGFYDQTENWHITYGDSDQDR